MEKRRIQWRRWIKLITKNSDRKKGRSAKASWKIGRSKMRIHEDKRVLDKTVGERSHVDRQNTKLVSDILRMQKYQQLLMITHN